MSIRLRLALLYALLLAAALVLSNLLVYGLMAQHFQVLADESVANNARHVASTILASGGSSDSAAGPNSLLLPSLDAFAAPGTYLQVLGPDGRAIAHSSNLGDSGIPMPVQVSSAIANGGPSYFDAEIAGDRVRVFTEPLQFGASTDGFVQIARSYHEDDVALASLRLAMLAVGSIALLGTGVLSWGMAGRALKPISTLTDAAEDIASSRVFSRRVRDTRSRDELGALARTFNEMLDSLEGAYSSQQRFVADASHELRTPLTVIQGNLELLRNKGDGLPREERAALADAAGAEAERMARLVDALLALARADAGQELARRPVELDRVLLDVYQQARVLNDRLALASDGSASSGNRPSEAGPGGKVRLRISELDQLQVTGDPDRLRQLLLALVDNALKYTQSGGEVSLGLRREGANALLEVRDTGIGISSEDLPRIFERFYRSDKARSRALGGTGLGLSIASWIAEEHGGEILVESTLGGGSTFTVRLPLSEDVVAVPTSTGE